MFEWIVMGFFIGIPLLLVVGALVAWIRHQREDFTIEAGDHPNPRVGGNSPA